MAGNAVEERTGSEVKRPNGVDPHEEPSAEWGWHGTFPKVRQGVGWFFVFAMLVMLIGPHESRTEDLYLIGFAVTIACGLIYDIWNRRNAWRR
ncbi:hypothetical protein BJF85_14670 [Saccharomonospora sp. CUA-673]|uniref:DUF2631 domain-containing protein n=1 Tax=Saccharomonospora sp. CUA-673 TaxID=1904969 RepID=UPI000959318D|nr:DUF2631 domain-containing protein [Saccharomonospora sp. CUA-673]OLT47882.1 hypothetical protein BJF85_14670 [Saccharomonospora sp. CUA-673]